MQPLYSESSEEKPTNGSLEKRERQKQNDVIIPSDSILKSVTRSIECAVCLERLRIEDNRVLPCQHTYHYGCLELTLAREGELRCPECRRLSDVYLDDLLPNYTLNKILESLPLDQHTSTTDIKRKYLRTRSLNVTSLILQNLQNDPKQTEQPMPLCKALYDYKAQHKTDLSFKRGDLIVLLRQLDEHWFLGEAANSQGTFPVNYVQVINPLVGPLCKALFNFEAKPVEELSLNSTPNLCLYFSKNDVIDLMERIDQSWAKGKIGSSVGIFPLNFVAINGAARELLNEWCRSNHRMDLFLDAKSSAGPDPWFYTNSTTEKALTLNRHSYSTSARKSRARSLTSQSLILSSPDEEDCDDAKGRGRGGSLTPTTYQSFSSILATQQHTGRVFSSRFSTLGSSKVSHTEMYIAKHNYCARRGDELDLEAGKWYAVSQVCTDGWYKGTNIETGQSGAFPGNFVFPAELNKSKSAAHRPSRRSLSTVDGVSEASSSDSQQPQLGLDEKIRKLSLNSQAAEDHDTSVSSPSADSQRWVTLSGYGYQRVHPTELNNNQSSNLQQKSASEPTKSKQYVATLSYPPQNDTEVELVCGDVIMVHKQDPDGWLTGTVQRTGKSGLLPASFVKEIENHPPPTTSYSIYL